MGEIHDTRINNSQASYKELSRAIINTGVNDRLMRTYNIGYDHDVSISNRHEVSRS